MGKLFAGSSDYLSRTLRATSELQDLAHYAADDAGMTDSRRQVWVTRPLPLRCEACGIACDSYAAFFAHCDAFAHKELLLDEHQRLDAKYCDPRYAADEFKNLSGVQQYKAVVEFRNFMTQHLKSELWPEEDNPGLDEHMQEYADMANDSLEEFYPEVANNMTIQDAKRGWFDFIMSGFYSEGVDHYISRCVTQWLGAHRWGSRCLVGCITGEDFR